MISKYLLNICLFTAFVLLSSCNSGGDGFSKLEDTTVSNTNNSKTTVESKIEIESFTPSSDPVVLKSSDSKTFAIQIKSGAGEVNYKFLMDNGVVQNGTSSFYLVDASSINTGDHTLKVVAKNTISSAEHSFNIHKNTPPSVSLASNTSQTINCVSGTFTLSIAATDADSDALTFSYYLNGIANSSHLTGTHSSSTAQVVYNPICSQAGSNTVKIRATDANGEYSEYSMAVTVTNPNVASIDSYSPTSDPTVILSTGSQAFVVAASGNPPITYTWDITPGSTISSCASSSSCTIGGGDFTPGNYVLKASISDSLNTTANHSFNLTINDRPSIFSFSPSNSSTTKMNCSSSKNFQVKVKDQNIANGQSVTVNWYLDNSTHATLTSTLDTSVYPYVADATFSPNCTSSLLGDHTIKVVISDGHENQELQWAVSTNYFSDSCNTLASGEICTLVGMVGLGSGLNVTTQSEYLRFSPTWLESHPSGYFFTDYYRHGVWFYNPNSTAKTVLGKSIPANSVVALFGQNGYGKGTAGQSYTNFYLNNPRGLAYSASEDALYVAESGYHRIIKFNSSGVGSIFAGGGSSDTDGDPRTNHRCSSPIGIALDDTNHKLFTACNGNSTSTIKQFSTSTDSGTTLIRYSSYAATEGTTGYSGSARLGKSFALTLDPNSNILYAADYQKCRIVAISYGGTASYYGGEVVLGANEMKVLLNSGSCSYAEGRLYSDTGSRIRAFDLAVYSQAGVTKGIFYSNGYSHYIGLLNLTTSDISLGGNTIAGKYHHRIFGSGSYDYGRGEPAYSASYFRNPYGLLVNGTNLYVGDFHNGRIAKLDISVANGASSDLVGNFYYYSYDSEIDKHANLRQLSHPQSMVYSATKDKMYFADASNYRIRSIDLKTGRVSTEVGKGNGNSNTDPEAPLDAYMRNAYDLSLTNNDGMLLYADYYGGTGTNRNCLARGYNMSSSDDTFWGSTLEAGKVRSVAGSFPLGCEHWVAENEGSNALTIPFYSPSGIVSIANASSFYLSDMYQHCVHKVDSSGVVTTPIGECGTNGNVNGALETARVSYPGNLIADSDATLSASGNFFLLERPIYNVSKIKYVNLSGSSVSILGHTINSMSIGEVVSGVDYVSAVATFGNQICYSQGSRGRLDYCAHNVTCLDRTTALQTMRIGKVRSTIFNGGAPIGNAEEGIQGTSATLSGAYGLAFDSAGNLYISEYNSNTIRMVKRWF